MLRLAEGFAGFVCNAPDLSRDASRTVLPLRMGTKAFRLSSAFPSFAATRVGRLSRAAISAGSVYFARPSYLRCPPWVSDASSSPRFEKRGFGTSYALAPALRSVWTRPCLFLGGLGVRDRGPLSRSVGLPHGFVFSPRPFRPWQGLVFRIVNVRLDFAFPRRRWTQYSGSFSSCKGLVRFFSEGPFS